MKNKIRKHVLEMMEKNSNNTPILYEKLFNSSIWQNAKVVAVTISTEFELNTTPIIKRGLTDQKKIVIPKTFKNREMKFYKFEAFNTLVKSRFGILEPVGDKNLVKRNEIDLIIVPGIAFSPFNHHRIGYGGGFYDNYLQSYVGQTLSLVRKFQLVDSNWPIEATDIPVQHLLVEDINDES